MRSRLLAAAAVFALAPAAPAADPEQVVTYDVRILTVAAGKFPECGIKAPSRDGETVALTAAEVETLMKAAQGDRNVNVMGTPKMSATDGKDVTLRVVDTRSFVTGMDAVRVKDEVVFIPRNTSIDLGETIVVGGNLSADDKAVAVRAKLTSTHLIGNVELHPVVIRMTPTDKDGRKQKSVPFTQYLQAPEIDKVVIDTAATVPVGGYAVTAGPTRTEEQRVTARIPFLSDLPVVGEAFTNERVTRQTVRTYLIVSPTRVAGGHAVAPMPRAVTAR